MDDALVTVTLLLVAAAATVAVLQRSPSRQAVVLSLLGLALAALFTVLQAPDVGLAQLAVGSAVTPLMILLTVRKVRPPKTGPRTPRRQNPHPKPPHPPGRR